MDKETPKTNYRYILMPHGDVGRNGWLTEVGEQKTRDVTEQLVAAKMNICGIVASPWYKAKQTACIAASVLKKHGHDVKITQHLALAWEKRGIPELLSQMQSDCARHLYSAAEQANGAPKNDAAILVVSHPHDIEDAIELLTGRRDISVAHPATAIALKATDEKCSCVVRPLFHVEGPIYRAAIS